MSDSTKIVVRCSPNGEGFDCVIRPAPLWQPLDRESMPSYRAARRAAECLKIVHPDWKIDDQVPGTRRVAA